MDSNQDQDCTSGQSELPLPLPPGFKSIREIKDMPNDQVKKGTFVGVIGFLKDYQSPIQTRGTDYKCTLEIIDLSVKFEAFGMKINIFWPLKHLPSIFGPSDVVLVRNAKVQMYGGAITLLANKVSEFHILQHSRVPRDLSLALDAPWSSASPSKTKRPNVTETKYVISANKHVGDLDLPSDTEFQVKAAQASTVKDKFSLMKDLKPDCFYNILGEVIKVYDNNSERITVYMSDYTPNNKFYNYAWGENPPPNDRDEDEYRYVKRKPRSETDQAWPGPYGKLSIQLTVFDENAEFFREKVKENHWVLLRNVQIKDTSGYLEGKLRGDRDRFEGKVQVEVIKWSAEDEQNDPRWEEAVARKHAWWQKFKTQKKAILSEDASGDKRKAPGGDAMNSKKRRKERRAAAEQKAAAIDARLGKKLGLNENITCAHPDQPIVSFAEILKPRKLMIGDNGREYASPFTICNYKANVRVVDYFPDNLEDFTVGHRASEYDILSDYSGGEDTDLEEERRIFKSGRGFAKNAWEWRFALQVEDASITHCKDRIWLIVDNFSAQYLLGLDEDATSLRGDRQLLNALREQLFKLWGDLEEQKSAKLQLAKKADLPPSSFQSSTSESLRRPRAGDQPDADDSDAEDELPHEIILPKSNQNDESELVPRNKPFTCCIRQYGVKVPEDDPSKANAGEGRRWERMFGLFDTHIN
ncbi:uncharacterized protein BP5553_04140 [Venustampulla echinocandica]|uniref:Protection of telomeres protein 1 n=1 Tax=Venustampulla echinocandica TaxID=2656787 RepID=A0A370TWA2_9HELO|nr:uncharacterized protein BP5553_04140 [Venustampulla echinocandica]RDL39800.1 hypothetical protein BP5553_04140 [Venustampulla echinocandica]